jgi:hypothetical protein
MALGLPARHAPGYVLDALRTADRSAAVFLNNQSHGAGKCMTKKGCILLDFQGKNEVGCTLAV